MYEKNSVGGNEHLTLDIYAGKNGKTGCVVRLIEQ